jgi:hypothetical protein
MGLKTTASASFTTAMGMEAEASGANSFAIGLYNQTGTLSIRGSNAILPETPEY